MFYGCNSLKRENVITKDDKILKALDKIILIISKLLKIN